ncbi:hypothetical protein J3R83DRAFT_2681 [Lanmaoa asiatica]|nr:hypothetical protein J3R83DRAFT_2681 [Lanmaoa asiatica]
MVNLRSRSKARAALKMEPTAPTPSTASGNWNLSEVALRKLPRAELQKLAMAHKVKANMKSELIIQQLSSLRIPKRTRPAEDDPAEGTSRKRFKRETASEEISVSPTPKKQAALPDIPPTQDTPVQSRIEDPRPPEAGPSAPRSIPPAHKVPSGLSYDETLFSGTESEMTEEEQLDFATPISSRSGTPPLANVKELNRCVTIMQEISAKDVVLLNEVTEVRETAAKLRKRARNVRDLVKAERGRRERMEAYFRYWQETEPTWHRKWLYGEKMVPDYKIRLEELDEPAGPPTILNRQYAQGGQNLGGPARPATPVPARKPTLSPEELKQKRQAIVLRQEAEQRELEVLRRREMLGENSSREGSSEEADGCSLGEGSSLADLPSADENDMKEPLMISFENSVGTIAASATSP